MTVAEIDERIAHLTGQLDQVLASANAIKGAIEDCKFWRDRAAAQETPQGPHPIEPT